MSLPLDIWLKKLASPSPFTRSNAIRALSESAVGGSTLLPHLLQALHDDHLGVRDAALCALQRLGKTTAVVPVLIATLADESASFRAWAARALGEIGSPALVAVTALKAAVGDQAPHVGVRAAEALYRIGIPGEAAARPLRKALDRLLAELRLVGSSRDLELVTTWFEARRALVNALEGSDPGVP